jgi:acylphosphatase
VKRLHLWLSGCVQGVWFRESTREQAEALGVAGWVRNLPDGRVEAVLEGEAGAVDALGAWCRHGPEGAEVEDVQSAVEPVRGEPKGFRVVR